MGFVNAHASAEDIEKYGLDLLDKRFFLHAVDARQWTVDRERGLYLRIATMGGDAGRRESKWTFLWRKELLFLVFEADHIGAETGPTRYVLRQLDLADALQRYREDIIDAIEEALRVYRHGGTYAGIASFSLALESAPRALTDAGGLYLMGC